MNQSGRVGTGDSATQRAFQQTHDGDLSFRRVHSDLLTFHHQLGCGMDYYDEAITLLREAGHDELADNLLAPVARGALTGRWTWSIVEEYEDRFFETTANMERDLQEMLDESATEPSRTSIEADGGPTEAEGDGDMDGTEADNET